MTRFQAYLTIKAEPSLGARFFLDPGLEQEKAALWCVTYASLSGQLDTAQSPDDLHAAVVAGINMEGSHQISKQQFDTESRVVKDEVDRGLNP